MSIKQEGFLRPETKEMLLKMRAAPPIRQLTDSEILKTILNVSDDVKELNTSVKENQVSSYSWLSNFEMLIKKESQIMTKKLDVLTKIALAVILVQVLVAFVIVSYLAP